LHVEEDIIKAPPSPPNFIYPPKRTADITVKKLQDE